MSDEICEHCSRARTRVGEVQQFLDDLDLDHTTITFMGVDIRSLDKESIVRAWLWSRSKELK